jgi:hypothetical protein
VGSGGNFEKQLTVTDGKVSPSGELDLDDDESMTRLEVWMTQTLDVNAGAALTCSLNQAALDHAIQGAVGSAKAKWAVDAGEVQFEGVAFQPGFATGTALAIIRTDAGAVSTRSWTETVKLVPPNN